MGERESRSALDPTLVLHGADDHLVTGALPRPLAGSRTRHEARLPGAAPRDLQRNDAASPSCKI